MRRIVTDFDNEWTTDLLDEIYERIEEIAVGEMGYNIYPNQIEIISSEGMLEAYATVGLPVMYTHWSFGKRYLSQSKIYKSGLMGLAYEIVINSDPCVSYLMEGNTLTMQTLVMAHACVSGDTEYLSPAGWRRMSDYDNGLVAQYDEYGRAQFVKPTRYIKRGQSQFIHVNGARVEQKITVDHRVPFFNGNGNLVVITGDELKQRHEDKTRGFNGRFATGFRLETTGTGLDMTDDEIRLHIAIKADGHIIENKHSDHFNCVDHDRVRFHLKKPRKIARLEELLNRARIVYTKVPSYDGRYVITFGIKRAIDKRYTSDWYNANIDQLYVIADEILHWDGSPRYHAFSSAHKQDVDFIQFVWAATGKHTHIREENRAWTVRYSENPLSGLGSDRGAAPFEMVDSEDGFAYCFTVSSGMFVTRLNGKISVTGNCMGHNHFFKNNYLFKQWTQPEFVLDYLGYAKRYIMKCEEKYGIEAVELILDAAHAVEHYSVDKYNRKRKSKTQTAEDLRRRVEWEDAQFDPLVSPFRAKEKIIDEEVKVEPTENLLYFIEKQAPDLRDWQREIVRIVRKVGQYFYPQLQLQLMNEGFATASHAEIVHRMDELGLVDEAFMLEFVDKHSGVLGQQRIGPGSPLKYINVYKLGYEMFMDIKRRCQDPTDEDKYWFPDQVGRPYRDVWFEAVAGFKDESFITQYLSPEVVRKMQLMSVLDTDKNEHYYNVSGIANDESFEHMRKYLSYQYDLGHKMPQVSIYDVNWSGDRTLKLRHDMQGRRPLHDGETKKVLRHLNYLWGFPVKMESFTGSEVKHSYSYP